ncbi:MAG: TlpA family protein disulfide reductase [Nitrosomonas sp.]|nr:TlpA family protein disulfide reductase [Nitrosomonas sp.]MDP1951318.1 TlpA family protein disulfide reductase [Nitrosomonas sp.]
MSNPLFSDITVDTWVQGGSVTADDLVGSVVLVEVFQVNCPGCFLYALPKAIQLHEKYQDKGLVVIGLATAFEDYDKNTLENLQRLVETGEVIGQTFKALHQHGMLTDGKLGWRLPFAVGMDRVVPESEPVTDERVLRYTREFLPEFETFIPEQKQAVLEQVKQYMEQKTMRAETFERFALQGTPSAILFDRKGRLRDVSFGQIEHQQSLVEQCLAQED